MTLYMCTIIIIIVHIVVMHGSTQCIKFEEGLFFVYHGYLLFAEVFEMWWPTALELQTVQSVLF